MSKLNPMNIVKAIRWMARGTWRNLKRIYAFALAFIICFLTYQALAYLIVGLLKPTETPAQISQLPRRMDEALLKENRRDWRGLDVTERPRTPPAHYHRIDGWVQPDRFSGCTTSGCHSPMPHNEHKEVRAFLNMHATSIHCGTCHMKSDRVPLSLTWYNLTTGKAEDPPAILRAYGLLTSDEYAKERENPDDAFQQQLADLLQQAAEDADNLPALKNLAGHFDAVRATSTDFKELLIQARAMLPRHFRGEYGAKIAQRGVGGAPMLSHPNTKNAVAEYLRRKDTITGQDRQDLLNRVHPLRRKEPLDCSACHTKADSLINFELLGYPPARTDSLVHPIVLEMIEHIRQGTPFHLPDFIGGGEK